MKGGKPIAATCDEFDTCAKNGASPIKKAGKEPALVEFFRMHLNYAAFDSVRCSKADLTLRMNRDDCLNLSSPTVFIAFSNACLVEA